MTKSIDLWVFSLDPRDDVATHLSGLLDDGERRRALNRTPDVESRRLTVAHGRRREILSKYVSGDPAQLAFDRAPAGKPLLVAAGQTSVPFFNMTHSGSLGAVAVSRDLDVGVDLEVIREVRVGLADRYFTPAECLMLASIKDRDARQRAFFRCWTCKEAILKATGEGIRRGLDTFVVGFGEDTCPSVLSFDGNETLAKGWFLRSFEPAADVEGAIAARSENENVRLQTFMI